MTTPEGVLGWTRDDCPKCGGEGVIYSGWNRQQGEDGETVCPGCGGSGWVVAPIPHAPEGDL